MANTVTLRFVGDTRDLTRSFNVVNSGADQTQSKFGAFASRMKAYAAGAGAALAVNFARQSVDAFKEAQAAQAKLEGAFAKFPSLADTNINALRRLNSELAKKTKFDDDATASGQAVLASFKLTGAQIRELTPLLQDYASRTGKDLPTAAQDLGKAILGQGRSLKALGVNFKDLKDPTANFNQLMDVLRGKVGGFAEREGKTAAGQAEILKNQFGELQEKVGSVLVPALTDLADALLKVIDDFQKLPDWVQTAIAVLAGLAAAIFVVTKAVQAWTAAQAVLNLVLEANPIILIVTALVALAVGLVIAYQKVEWFHNAVDGLWQGIQKGFDWIKNNWPLLAGIIGGPFGTAAAFIIKNWDRVKDLFNDILGVIGRVIDKISKLPGAGVAKTILHAVGIPGFATGGIVPGPVGAPMLAVVHGGEEVRTPAQQRAGGGGGTINIYMPPGSDGDDVVNALKRWSGRNGPVPIRTTG